MMRRLVVVVVAIAVVALVVEVITTATTATSSSSCSTSSIDHLLNEVTLKDPARVGQTAYVRLAARVGDLLGDSVEVDHDACGTCR